MHIVIFNNVKTCRKIKRARQAEGKERGRKREAEKGRELRERGDQYIEVRSTKLLKYSGRLPFKLFPPKPLGRGDDEEGAAKVVSRDGSDWIVHSRHLGELRKSVWDCSRKIETSKVTLTRKRNVR